MSTPAGERTIYFSLWRDVATTPAADANTGQIEPQWVIYGHVWGALNEATQAGLQQLTRLMHRHDKAAAPSGNVEQWMGFHLQVQASSVIRIPYIDGVNEKDRVSREHRGSRITYELSGPPLDLNSELVLLCNEIIPPPST
jgi:hypothetical protein